VAEARRLSRHFSLRRNNGRRVTVRAVDEIDLLVARGSTLGVVGESGSGKSTLARLLLRLLPPTSGTVMLDGQDVTRLRGGRLRALRHKMQLVFQDPYSSFDPLAPIGSSVGEALHSLGTLSRRERRHRTIELLAQVHLPAATAERRPRELSGGQLQRAAIARALAAEPSLLALDEPVSSLDIATQGEVVDVLAELQDERGLSYLFISHDLDVVGSLSHDIAVMYLGRMVETGPATVIFGTPRHPYTSALLAARPSFTAHRSGSVPLIGDIPSAVDTPSGCRFRTRCPHAMEICRVQEPPPNRGPDGSTVWCHLFPSGK
jgi:oligopeptide/dipeptide ABC transporter ATP-binding protein